MYDREMFAQGLERGSNYHYKHWHHSLRGLRIGKKGEGGDCELSKDIYCACIGRSRLPPVK